CSGFVFPDVPTSPATVPSLRLPIVREDPNTGQRGMGMGHQRRIVKSEDAQFIRNRQCFMLGKAQGTPASKKIPAFRILTKARKPPSSEKSASVIRFSS